MSNAAYRKGWDRIFAPKVPPQMLRCPFSLRRGIQIEVTLPHDLKVSDLRRFVWYLATMCDDWDTEMGMPEIVFPGQADA